MNKPAPGGQAATGFETDDRQLPIELNRPSDKLLAAMAELNEGKGTVAHSIEELMEQLDADD